MIDEDRTTVENFLAEHLPGGLQYFRKDEDMDIASDDLARIILAALHREPKPVVAYYVPGEGAFYVAPTFMSRKYIPEKHRKVAVRLVEEAE
jgi:hypothetical protein